MYFANLAIHRIYDSRHFLAFYISIFSLFFSIYLIFFFYFKVICLLKKKTKRLIETISFSKKRSMMSKSNLYIIILHHTSINTCNKFHYNIVQLYIFVIR